MVDFRACGVLVRSGYGDRVIWDAGYGASVRGPRSTGVMVRGLPVASGCTHLARSRREPASRDRTTDRIRVAAPGSSTPGTSAPKTVRGVRLSGLTPAQSTGTVDVLPVREPAGWGGARPAREPARLAELGPRTHGETDRRAGCKHRPAREPARPAELGPRPAQDPALRAGCRPPVQGACRLPQTEACTPGPQEPSCRAGARYRQRPLSGHCPGGHSLRGRAPAAAPPRLPRLAKPATPPR
ncbi:hypothetical protein QFZ76_006734 [Streptomyces sp. V4I2]|nr:hypothetical protein [Streptomyces sp. V4I2]